MGNPELPVLGPFLDRLQIYGFNYILLNAYAHDTPLHPGKTETADYGPPDLYPWEGNNESPRHERFHLAYWQHYDRVIETLYQRGMMAHLRVKNQDRLVNWPATDSPEDELYFKWLLARYSAFPNLIWDVPQYKEDVDSGYYMRRLQMIKACDPYKHLLTSQTGETFYDRGLYHSFLDFQIIPEREDIHTAMINQRSFKECPQVYTAFGTKYHDESPAIICNQAWDACTAGGYASYVYNKTARDIIHTEDTPAGYEYSRYLRNFFTKTHYWMMEPADELVTRGHCLAKQGKEYVVFLRDARPVSLQLEEGSYSGEWYHPLTGKRKILKQVVHSAMELKPPPDWVHHPLVLHIKSIY